MQDRLWKERERVGELFRNGARVYVGGSWQVGKAVQKTTRDIYIEDIKARGEDLDGDEEGKAKGFIVRTRSERYAVDVFSWE